MKDFPPGMQFDTPSLRGPQVNEGGSPPEFGVDVLQVPLERFAAQILLHLQTALNADGHREKRTNQHLPLSNVPH